jgi:hypothetical protein
MPPIKLFNSFLHKPSREQYSFYNLEKVMALQWCSGILRMPKIDHNIDLR